VLRRDRVCAHQHRQEREDLNPRETPHGTLRDSSGADNPPPECRRNRRRADQTDVNAPNPLNALIRCKCAARPIAPGPKNGLSSSW